MARILLVEDDLVQLDMWRMLLERNGHEVAMAGDREKAVALLRSGAPDVIIMDWGLPRPEDGRELLTEARRAAPGARILVLTGWPNLDGDDAHPDEVVMKPVRVERLLEAVARLMTLLLCVAAAAFAQRFSFETSQAAEVVAELEMTAGREGAPAALTTDGLRRQHATVWAGGRRRTYSMFLGALEKGPHTLEVSGEGVRVERVSFVETAPGDVDYTALAHAPILYARPDTVERFSDVPLLMYCERLGDTLEYTVIFSNEDGGTDTAALMARWGRTTDIEYIYRHRLGSGRATIQAKDHKEIEFAGRREGAHPILFVSTQNNMVAAEGKQTVRYQLAPLVVDLAGATRESVMDRDPLVYRAMARELERENKGVDPRDYLYVEMRLRNTRGAVAVLARRGRNWTASHRGRADYAIPRSEWVRTAVEAPGSGFEEIAIQCIATGKADGECRVESLKRVFRLDEEYRPGPNLAAEMQSLVLATGSAVSVPFRSRR